MVTHAARSFYQRPALLVAGGVLAALVVGIAIGAFIAPTGLGWWTEPETRAEASELARNYGLIIAGLVGFGLGFWRVVVAHQQRVIAERRQVTEAYTRAIDQLGSDSTFARVGAIYALERIAWDSERDHWPIMETLSAFVRDEASSDIPDIKKREKPDPPVQAALTVIGRRRYEREGKREFINLVSTHLKGVDLRGAVLRGAVLTDTNLSSSQLFEALLSEGLLFGADLSDSYLDRTNLSNALLMRANLIRAAFLDTDLSGADLGSADLRGASLTCEILTKAKNWQHTYRDPILACGADIPVLSPKPEGQSVDVYVPEGDDDR